MFLVPMALCCVEIVCENLCYFYPNKIMEHQKKKRGENWSSEEKEILRQLIAQSAHIIEDKSTKTSINILKTKEWKNIMNKLNEITGKSRSDAEIKLAWKRMKLAAKSNLSAHRKEQSQTGGGEKPPSPSPEDLAIMAITPHDFIIEFNQFDSDAKIQTTTTTQDPIAGPSSEIIDPVIVIDEENPEPNVMVEKAENTVPSKKAVSHIDTANKTGSVIKRKKTFQNRNEEMRHLITESNIEFKKRQIEMMEVEHEYNIKISELKIKKIALEIALLESKNISSK